MVRKPSTLSTPCARPGPARPHASEAVGRRRVPRRSGPGRGCRSSWSRPGRPRSTPWSGSRSAPTTTHEAVPAARAGGPDAGRAPSCTGDGRRPADEPATRSRSATSASTPSATRCIVRGAVVSSPLEGVRVARDPARQRGPGAHPGHPHRPRWGPIMSATPDLDVHISGLRARIEQDPSRPVCITTIRGLGYRYEAPRSGQ